MASPASDLHLENPTLLQSILYRVDNNVLRLLSRTPIWLSINKGELRSQHFWFLRTQSLLDLPPELNDWNYGNNKNENWYQIYNILAATRDRANPFQSQVLENNGYNYLAVKWLLERGYDPSANTVDVLSDAAAVGSSETLQLLLADERIDPVEDKAIQSSIVNGRLDNLQVLLADERIANQLQQDQDSLKRQVLIAAKNDQVEMLNLLVSKLDEYDDSLKERIARKAAENDSLAVLQSIDRKIVQDNANNLMHSAAHGDSPRIAEFVLDLISQDEDESIDESEFLYSAMNSDSLKVFHVLTSFFNPSSRELLQMAASDARGEKIIAHILEDQSLNEIDIMHAIQVTNSHEPIQVLLEDTRANNVGRLLVGLLYKHNNDEWHKVILRSRQISLDEVALSQLRELTSRGYSSETEELIMRDCHSYNECHFELLMREVAIKRRDLAYYLDWLIERTARHTTSQEVRQLIATAAASALSNDPANHTSGLFTAYSAFFLLGNRAFDRDKILELIANEGASRDGIKKATLLLDTFLDSQPK